MTESSGNILDFDLLFDDKTTANFQNDEWLSNSFPHNFEDFVVEDEKKTIDKSEGFLNDDVKKSFPENELNLNNDSFSYFDNCITFDSLLNDSIMNSLKTSSEDGSDSGISNDIMSEMKLSPFSNPDSSEDSINDNMMEREIESFLNSESTCTTPIFSDSIYSVDSDNNSVESTNLTESNISIDSVIKNEVVGSTNLVESNNSIDSVIKNEVVGSTNLVEPNISIDSVTPNEVTTRLLDNQVLISISDPYVSGNTEIKEVNKNLEENQSVESVSVNKRSPLNCPNIITKSKKSAAVKPSTKSNVNKTSKSVPSITTRGIKLDTHGLLNPSFSSESTVKVPIKKNNTQTVIGKNYSTVTSISQKSAPSYKNGTVVKVKTVGKPFYRPINLNELQVSTIKIVNPSSNKPNTKTIPSNQINRHHSTNDQHYITPILIDDFVSTTSKTADGQSIIKLTPTACVAPQQKRSLKYSRRNYYSSDEEEEFKPNRRLILTDEEKKLMRKESLVLPSRYPLTKEQERDLKRIRRKIRNKISAQDSRKRKKEYMDRLEEKMQDITDENTALRNRLKNMQYENASLTDELEKMRSLLGQNTKGKAKKHSSAALMMLILSTALIVTPSLKTQNSDRDREFPSTVVDNSPPSLAGNSRRLLQVNDADVRNVFDELSKVGENNRIRDYDVMSRDDFSAQNFAPNPKRARTSGASFLDNLAGFLTDTSHRPNSQSISNYEAFTNMLSGVFSPVEKILPQFGKFSGFGASSGVKNDLLPAFENFGGFQANHGRSDVKKNDSELRKNAQPVTVTLENRQMREIELE